MSRLFLLVAALLLLSGCAVAPQTKQLLASRPNYLPTQHHISNVPFFPQEKYQCGPASLAMALNYANINTSPQALVKSVYVPEKKGAFQVEMLATTRANGRLALTIEPNLDSLLGWVAANQPVLVLQNLALSWYPQWHYAVVTGYDLDKGTATLHSGTIENYTVSLSTFERTWARVEYWGMVVLEPGTLPLAENADTYFLAVAAFEETSNSGLAGEAWQTGLAKWPESKNLLMGYGNFLYGKKSFSQAERQFKAVISLYPDYAPAYNNLADTLIQLDQSESAIDYIEKAIELDPEHRSTYTATLREAKSHTTTAPNFGK